MEHNREEVEKAYAKNSGLREDVEIIKNWLQKQPHLPKMDELLIVVFLKKTDNNVEKAKAKIDLFCTMRSAMPEIFTNLDPDQNRVFDEIIFMVLPKLTPKGERIVYAGYRDPETNFDNYQFSERYKMIETVLSWGYLRSTSVTGVLLINAQNLKIRQIVNPNFNQFARFQKYWQKALPINAVSIEIINIPNFVGQIQAFFRPCLSEKIQQKIHFHQNLETLYERIPKDCLPNECGGTLGGIEELYANFRRELSDNKHLLVNAEKIKSDESKRARKIDSDLDIFGIDGTFKKINLD